MISQKKLVINLMIFLICGTVAISLPIIVNNLQKPTNASTGETTAETTVTDWQLVGVFVGDRYQNKMDACVVWQIEQKSGNTIITTWDEIYASISTTNPLNYDTEHLTLTRYGLVYHGAQTAEDYQNLKTADYHSTVIYQNHSCVLTLN